MGAATRIESFTLIQSNRTIQRRKSPQMAQRVREAAGQMESFCDGISNRKVGDLVNAASDLARNRPVAFLAGAVLGGFAFARFLKSRGNGQSASARRAEPTGLSAERSHS